jgi:predicted nucleotide-binding protein
MMMPSNSIFKQINNTVLDLQGATYQTYPSLVKVLGKLLRHGDLEPFNARITQGLDLEAFLAANPRTRGGMIGSGSLDWPDDAEEALGLKLLLVQKFSDDPDFMLHFSHDFFHVGNNHNGCLRAMTGQLIVPFVRDYKDYVLSGASTEAKLVMPLSTKVFVVHGHDEGARESVARFLEKIGFEAIILHEQANQGRTVIEKIEAYSDVGYAVVLLTPDDYGGKAGEPTKPRARQNVILELGYFVGRLGRGHVCALMRGEIEVPSDWNGVVYQAMDTGGGWKGALAKELAAVGHDIDWAKVMQ